ncbi:MAG: sulfur carrier protein ThiS [Deltaproteobacteria bacterium]|nr:sulfur carrier protein ThiS [Deltaproteobacteria bacterium]
MIRVKGKQIPWREGMTVADLLRELKDPYPYAVVRINDRTVSGPNFEKTLVPDHSEVFPIPLVAGG